MDLMRSYVELADVFSLMKQNFLTGFKEQGCVMTPRIQPFIKTARHYRILRALIERPHSRMELGKIVGALNVPHHIMELRRQGWCILTERSDLLDRDGRKCRPGFYSLSEFNLKIALEIAEEWERCNAPIGKVDL